MTPDKDPTIVARQNRVAAKITHIHNALVKSAPLAKVLEATFVNEILPYYAGTSTDPNIQSKIAALAGSPFLEYEVVDASGEVLFVAPPLLEREMYEFKNFGKDITASGIFQTAALLANRSPRQAEAFINQQLNRRGLTDKAHELTQKFIKRRDEILARYGLAPSENKVSSSDPEKEKPTLDYSESELL